jgi:hypothetical protein
MFVFRTEDLQFLNQRIKELSFEKSRIIAEKEKVKDTLNKLEYKEYKEKRSTEVSLYFCILINM